MVSWALESRIPLIIGIRCPNYTEKKSEIQDMKPIIHRVESRIPDCLGLLYMRRDKD